MKQIDVKLIWNRFWIWVRNILIFFFVSSFLAVLAFKWVPVYRTPLMYLNYINGKATKISHQWVDMKQISANMPAAVISSEDANFLDPIPNPQSPIPNPQSPIPKILLLFLLFLI